jgi:hypothetical protein
VAPWLDRRDLPRLKRFAAKDRCANLGLFSNAFETFVLSEIFFKEPAFMFQLLIPLSDFLTLSAGLDRFLDLPD